MIWTNISLILISNRVNDGCEKGQRGLVVGLFFLGFAGAVAAAAPATPNPNPKSNRVELPVLGPATGELDWSAETRWI